MQFRVGSSSQRTSFQGGSSNPEGRRLDSKVLPNVRRLGKGLSGYLYETTWKRNKYIRKDFPLGSVHHNVFEKEAIALLDLGHRNIVKCPHYTVDKSSCSLLLEYVDDDLQNIIQKNIEAQGKGNRAGSSTTLHSRLLDIHETRSLMSSMAKRREITEADVGLMRMPENEPTAAFELPEAVDIIFQIATGVKYLHENRIVHGDLKPNNVLVGNDGIVKLVDFGLVETKKRIKLVSKRTRHFEILMWKAPELFEKLLGPVTEDSDDPFSDSDTDENKEIESSVIFTESRLAKADVYSFGLVCSQVLGGKLMYSNLSLTQLRKQRMHDFRPQLPSTCPEGLRSLIFSSVERDPLRRPTFANILTDLEALRPHLMGGLGGADFMKIDGSSFSKPSEDHGAREMVLEPVSRVQQDSRFMDPVRSRDEKDSRFIERSTPSQDQLDSSFIDSVRNFFRRKGAPKAGELLYLCVETIQKLSARYSSLSTEDDRTEGYRMNRYQCHFLVGRLTETRDTLEKIQLSPLLDEKTIPVLEELHQVLLEVERVISASRITSSQWPRAAIEQSDMKETFASLLYGVQWHASVLLSIFVDSFRESSITFEPTFCEGQLSMGDEFSLLTAMKKDEESLKDRLRSVKLNDPTEQWLANEFLKLKMRSEKEGHLNTSYQLPENSGALKDSESSSVADDSTGFSLATLSPDTLFLNPQDLDLDGSLIGQGSFAEVKITNLMGREYAIKIFRMLCTEAFDKEMISLQRLGHHPHIVHLLGYSKDDQNCFLIMEKLDNDLHTVFWNYRKRKELISTRPLSDVQAVALMLQIGEGVKYIHSKRMVHRDLKSGNVLVNIDSSSRISSVKIAGFDQTESNNATQIYSNQTLKVGTTKWMAPEVMGDDPMGHSILDLRKADVYSFAILCFEILTAEVPYYNHDELSLSALKKQVKAGTLRPNLPEDCPPKLAALIRRCWHPIPQERPLFPEICKVLRYIKGLLLRGDWRTLEFQDI